METESATDADTTLERPSFRGCVFCYGAEMTYYGARKLASGLRSD